MGKRSSNESTSGGDKNNVKEIAGKSFLAEDKAVDPTLALLFASSVSLYIMTTRNFANENLGRSSGSPSQVSI